MSRDADTFADNTPLVIGHRGASAVAPENTLAAFERALCDGADGIEFDVRLSGDGVPVCIHDATLRRTARSDAAVAALTSAELQRADVGTWFNLCFPHRAQPSYAGEPIPTLAETLELVGPRSSVIYIEMKCDAAAEYAALAAAVVRQIRDSALARLVVVKCFRHEALREIKRLAPDIRTAALFDRTLARPVIAKRTIIARALACGANEISLHRSLARRAVVESARSRGFEIVVWTVDGPAWAGRARAWGIRSLITNDPAPMRAALAETRM